jgi:hypothetical protein
VDATYRADLRELNELNFARFDAKLEQRLAEFETKVERRLTQFAPDLGNRLEARFDKRLNQVTRLIVLAWITTIAVVIGVGLR